LDYPKLERTIVHLSEALPEQPQWAALSTIEGKFLRQYPTLLDGEKIAALTRSSYSHDAHALNELNDGALDYNIAAGSEGIFIVFVVRDKYLLSLNFKQLNSIDAVVKAVQSNLTPLLEQLGIS
jgi:hypothetical protein